MRIQIIDDDEYNREALRDAIAERLPDATIELHATPHAAWKNGGGDVDLIVIDISACGSIMMAHQAYAPICHLMKTYPGASVFINSAVAHQTAESVKDDILEQLPETSVEVIPYPWHENAVDRIANLFSSPE